jgi:hypothetical protein
MIVNGPKISTMVSAANGDTYGDGIRHELRTQQAILQANVLGGLNPMINTPPGSPVNGNTYIVGTAPSGAWASQAGNIAYWGVDPYDGGSITPNIATGAWEFYAPLAGWVVQDNVTGANWEFNGTTWVLASSLKSVLSGSGTVTLYPATANSFRINVTAAVTSVVITNTPPATSYGAVNDGQIITVEWVQTTGFAVSGFAANIHGVGFLTPGVSYTYSATPSASANVISVQRYAWDAGLGNWYGVSLGISTT